MKHFALDSNILIYAEGSADDGRCEIAKTLIIEIGFPRLILPLQAAGETLRWLIRKGGMDKVAAVQKIETWLELCEPVGTTPQIFQNATQLITMHHFQVWDAIIVAAGADAGADYLLSEDMQHGFRWSGITILNPFSLSNEQRRALYLEHPIH